MKTIVLPPGYRLELVASEPMIQEPVAIDWDANGRLWVIEMPGYMEDMPATTELQPTGRISVLEDTNDDGKMDKKTVFLDKLVLPRTLKVLERGALIAEPPNLWLARDTNGDLVADTKELVTKTYGQAEANVEHNENSLLSRELGVAAYLAKPVRESELLNAIQTALNSRRRHGQSEQTVVRPAREKCAPKSQAVVDRGQCHQPAVGGPLVGKARTRHSRCEEWP